MSKLQEAYQFFRLQPGCSFDEVKRRYKRVALAWHPDRMASDEARKDAEEEMKLINHFFDILSKHYTTGH